MVRLSTLIAFLYNLANSVAAHNSSRGMVNCFNGATLDVEHRRSHVVLSSLSVERMYRQAPYARSLLSQNPCNCMLTASGQITFLLILIRAKLGIV